MSRLVIEAMHEQRTLRIFSFFRGFAYMTNYVLPSHTILKYRTFKIIINYTSPVLKYLYHFFSENLIILCN